MTLVHGAWADGSSWSKAIPILKNAGHHVIAVQLSLHSLADDIATVKRAIELVGGPIVLVGHSSGQRSYIIFRLDCNTSIVLSCD
jgi:pimeloyl-ACP methyl ester carboxylesterase